MAEKKSDVIRKTVDKIWPSTKKELEKAGKGARILLTKGEKYLREVSVKGVKQTKKVTLGLQKEKLYYTLGKIVSNIDSEKWTTSKKIIDCRNEIRKLERKIRSIKI